MNNEIAITIYDGRIVNVESRKDVTVTVFNYGTVKNSMFSRKKFDIISIENRIVEGKGAKAIIGVDDEF